MSEVLNKNIGHATAYAYAKSQGYTGTEEEFAVLMASYADVAEQAGEARDEAVQAKNDAVLAKDAAVGAKDTAVQSKDTAVQAKRDAEGAKDDAVAAQGLAEDARDSAQADALKSEGHAIGTQNGSTVPSTSPYYHNNSKWYSEQAGTSASTASNKADEASQSASDADQAKTDAVAAKDRAEEILESIPADYSQLSNDVTDLKTAMSAANKRLDAIEEAEGLHRYGVSGIGQSASALTRIWDAVGMTAQVGTDGDNSSVVNNFDDVTPFNRRKCVGKWHIVDGRAQFSVAAYLGDENYTEDGSIGDYVAVECPRAYYYNHNGIWAVSAHHYEGWEPFDIFCHNHNHDETFEYCYLPAYQLAVKDGHAVSLPGLDNEQGDYASLLNAARTYDGDGVEVLAMLQPSAVYFYEQMLYTIEFARQVPTAVLEGCISLRSNDADTLHFIDATHAVSNNYFVARVEGEFIAVTESAEHTSVTYKASHKIVSIERCDENGTPDASGTHQLMELEDLGKAYFTYEIGTEYNFAPRPWRTGSCNGVSTPSGSPVSNTSGYYPMKYRWRENIWGNQYHTSADLFNKRILNENQEYCLEWYLLKDPTVLTPAKNIGSADLEDTELFYKLSVDTPHDKYVNGYIKSRQYDEEYHDIWIPDAVTGASASTYYAVYAYLVNSYTVRSVRFGAFWYNGYVYLLAHHAPSYALAIYGGDLCFAQ